MSNGYEPTAPAAASGASASVAARRARAELKRALRAGELTFVAALARARRQADAAARMRVEEFLCCIPRVGPQRARAILKQLAISPKKRLGFLGEHQHARLEEFLLQQAKPTSKTRLTVLAGPTAVGKGTVANHIKAHYPDVMLSVSATTRKPRPGERAGVDYFFVSDEEFDRMVAAGELLEWAKVHNAYRYGTPRKPVEDALAAGFPVLLEIDLQGARQVRANMPQARLVFLEPPSWDELVRRLVGRGTEDEAERTRRLATAKVELAAVDEFDHTVVNSEVSEAARQVVDLMLA